MFGFGKKVVRKSGEIWQSAGYQFDVIKSYGELTDVHIEKLARAKHASRDLDEFCKDCERRGLTPRQCAQEIVDRGFSNKPGHFGLRLGQFNENPDDLLRQRQEEVWRSREDKPQTGQSQPKITVDDVKPAIPSVFEARRILDLELSKAHLDFTKLQPIVYYSLIYEVAAVGRVERTIEMMFEIVQEIKVKDLGVDEQELLLVKMYEERMAVFREIVERGG